MRHGQKDLGSQIEQTMQCCEDRDCLYPTWPVTECRRCGKVCTETCYYYLGALNARNRQIRYYQGQYPFLRLPKDERLDEKMGRYLALEKNPLCDIGGRVEGPIFEFRQKRIEEKKIAG